MELSACAISPVFPGNTVESDDSAFDQTPASKDDEEDDDDEELIAGKNVDCGNNDDSDEVDDVDDGLFDGCCWGGVDNGNDHCDDTETKQRMELFTFYFVCGTKKQK